VDLSQHLAGLLMEKAHQMLDLAAEFERRAKTPTNGATTQEFLLAAAALRLAAQADAPLPLPTDKYAVDDPWCRPADVPQSPAVTDADVERAWAAMVGHDIASACHQASVVRGDIRTVLESYAVSRPDRNTGEK
jgi:hypothetical protein